MKHPNVNVEHNKAEEIKVFFRIKNKKYEMVLNNN